MIVFIPENRHAEKQPLSSKNPFPNVDCQKNEKGAFDEMEKIRSRTVPKKNKKKNLLLSFSFVDHLKVENSKR